MIAVRVAFSVRAAPVILAIAACQDPTSPETSRPSAETVRLAAENTPNVGPTGSGPISDRLVVIDQAVLVLASNPSEHNQGIFRFSIVREPDRLAEPGDILYLEAPGGLRRVLQVTRGRGEIAFRTTEAFWHEVIIGGTYRVSQRIPNFGAAIDSSRSGSGSLALVPLPEVGGSLERVDLCQVVGELISRALCGTEKTRIDFKSSVVDVELNGRLDSLVLSAKASITGDLDASYTIDPGGDIIPGTGRAPVFSPCNTHPHVFGCFAKAGDALRSFLISVGINPNVLPPLRMCVPGTPIVVSPGSLFPYRAPDIRICWITDFGALPDFTLPVLQATTIVARPHFSTELALVAAGTGTLKLTVPIPGYSVTQCFDHGNGFFCLKAGVVVVINTHIVDVGATLQTGAEDIEEITLSWTPETEWTHQRKTISSSTRANLIGNPLDTLSLRLGGAGVLEASLCFGGNSLTSCEDQGDNTTKGAGLIDLQLGVKAKVQLTRPVEAVWSRDGPPDNWHIDVDGFYELELEGALVLPRFLLRLDKNLKRSWTVECCRMELADFHGTGVLQLSTVTTGPAPDPDGYHFEIARADTLPGLVDPGATRLFDPNWTDSLSADLGVNASISLEPTAFCGVYYSDAVIFVYPIPVLVPILNITVPADILVPALRRLGVGVPNYAIETGCQLVIADYLVTISGVADHCVVDGGRTRRVTLGQGRLVPLVSRTRIVPFEIDCPTPSASPGTMEVTVTTTGFSLDSDGYQIEVDGMGRGALATNGSTSLTGLTPRASRAVGLAGLAANCQVSGANPQPVDVEPNATVAVHFDVLCSPIQIAQTSPSRLRVTTTTTGTSPDANGYTIEVNGVSMGSIGPSAELELTDLRPGVTDIVLGDIGSNCVVEPDTRIKLELSEGQIAAVSYAVTCTGVAPGVATGTVRVTVTTNGEDVDPDGYLLTVGGSNDPIEINGTRAVEGLSVGSVPLLLNDVAPNCAVLAELPLTVSVTANAVTDAAIGVRCQAYGRLEVTTTRAGQVSDPDGYRLVVDGIDRGPHGVEETRVIGQIVAGDHVVMLDGVVPNCRLEAESTGPGRGTKGGTEAAAPPNPVLVALEPGETAPVRFDLACIPPEDLAAIVLLVKVHGGNGAESYSVLVDGIPRGLIAAEEEMMIGQLHPGVRVIALDGIASDCRVNSQHPRSVVVPRGGLVPVLFNVVCGKGSP